MQVRVEAAIAVHRRRQLMRARNPGATVPPLVDDALAAPGLAADEDGGEARSDLLLRPQLDKRVDLAQSHSDSTPGGCLPSWRCGASAMAAASPALQTAAADADYTVRWPRRRRSTG